jgi:hypothetical protein
MGTAADTITVADHELQMLSAVLNTRLIRKSFICIWYYCTVQKCFKLKFAEHTNSSKKFNYFR